MVPFNPLKGAKLKHINASNYLADGGRGKDCLQRELKNALKKHYRRSAHIRVTTRRKTLFLNSGGGKSSAQTRNDTNATKKEGKTDEIVNV